MKPKPNKYKITEKHDLTVAACTIYPALINKGLVFVMADPIHGSENILQPYWIRCVENTKKPRPEFVSKASFPDSRMCIAISGPVHKKSHHRKFILINTEEDRVWYIKRTKTNSFRSNAYKEMRPYKEIAYGKLRRALVGECITIFYRWFSEQFH